MQLLLIGINDISRPRAILSCGIHYQLSSNLKKKKTERTETKYLKNNQRKRKGSNKVLLLQSTKINISTLETEYIWGNGQQVTERIDGPKTIFCLIVMATALSWQPATGTQMLKTSMGKNTYE